MLVRIIRLYIIIAEEEELMIFQSYPEAEEKYP